MRLPYSIIVYFSKKVKVFGLKMKICGVICEYNPFHNGHKYMLDRAREQSGCDFLVCVMSGNFTQRGEPAVSDKFSRAEYAVRAARRGHRTSRGIRRIARGTLCQRRRETLIFHPRFYRACIRRGERHGAKFCRDRQSAIRGEPRIESRRQRETENRPQPRAGARGGARTDFAARSGHGSFKFPNNILGIEYQKALFQFECGAQILPIPRVGAGYTDTKQYADYSSAAAIRKAAEDKKYRFIRRNVPEYVFRDVKNFTSPALYEKIAIYSVMSKPASELKKIADCTEGLENRIQALAKDNPDYGALIEKITTKRYISSRIRRIFAASVLNITEELIRQSLKNKLYLKILAVDREKAADILAALKNSVPADREALRPCGTF